MSLEIICEIKFNDDQTNEIHTIVAKIKKSQLLSTFQDWLSIKYTVLEKGKWIEVDNCIHKSNIQEIKIYKFYSLFTIDKLTYN